MQRNHVKGSVKPFTGINQQNGNIRIIAPDARHTSKTSPAQYGQEMSLLFVSEALHKHHTDAEIYFSYGKVRTLK